MIFFLTRLKMSNDPIYLWSLWSNYSTNAERFLLSCSSLGYVHLLCLLDACLYILCQRAHE